ncbi:permease [Thermococcus peptonophilus]|uniref:permease n=1 Tax=Thermococcus peptonophilus TaxID=53952 RepID=UPI0006CFC4E4
MVRDLIILGITLLVTAVLLVAFPDRRGPVIKTSWNFFLEMIQILPAVMVLLGLFAVFVPNEAVVRYLGKTSGIKGIFLAILLGTLPTGPLYVAFPIASALLKKGARISNIILFLSAWACIKIPQEMVELQFLGARFMLARLTLTVIFVVIMALAIEWIMRWSDGGEREAESPA